MLAKDGIALLPVRQNEATLAEKAFIDASLMDAVKRRFPNVKTVTPAQIEVLVNGSKEKPWVDHLVATASPNVVSRVEGIDRLSKRLGIRYLLQTDIRYAEVAGGAQHVRIFGRLWDGWEKEIVWSGYGEARGYVYLFFPAVPAPFEKDAKVAVNGLVSKLPKVH